ncbi:Cytosolic carboxypeptidase 1 [Chytridiales sp. JEL 0842]|nr:Cytosolic carboxypeptidase 1 [Chytridiales sp. JEL 0842]
MVATPASSAIRDDEDDADVDGDVADDLDIALDDDEVPDVDVEIEATLANEGTSKSTKSKVSSKTRKKKTTTSKPAKGKKSSTKKEKTSVTSPTRSSSYIKQTAPTTSSSSSKGYSTPNTKYIKPVLSNTSSTSSSISSSLRNSSVSIGAGGNGPKRSMPDLLATLKGGSSIPNVTMKPPASPASAKLPKIKGGKDGNSASSSTNNTSSTPNSLSTSVNNNSQPTSVAALRALDLLSVLLADPLLAQPTSTDDTSSSSSSTTASNSKPTSAPSSRRQSVTNSQLSLPRHLSDTALPGSSPNSICKPSIGNSTPADRELKRQIIKQCLELKRLFDKEGPTLASDSPLQKTLFGKVPSNGGVALLLKCLKTIPDVDLAITVTNLLLRFINNADSGLSNATFIAKKGGAMCLISCLLGIYNLHDPSSTQKGPVNASSDKILSAASGTPPSLALTPRLDELFQNIFGLMIKLNKHDPKLGLLARLHGAIEPMVDLLKAWQEKRDYAGASIALQALKLMGSKNDGNAILMHKKGLVSVTSTIISNSFQTLVKDSKETTTLLETAFDTMTMLAKTGENIVRDVAESLSIKLMVKNFSVAAGQGLQKNILKLLKVVLDSGDEYRKAFIAAEGVSVLTASLEELLENYESNNTHAPTGPQTLPYLLTSTIRSAVSETDLPFFKQIIHRHIPKCWLQPPSEAGLEFYEKLLNGIAEPKQRRKPDFSVNEERDWAVQEFRTVEEEQAFLKTLCPELEMLNGNMPPPSILPRRVVRTVYPTTTAIPIPPLNLNRPIDFNVPSLRQKCHPTNPVLPVSVQPSDVVSHNSLLPLESSCPPPFPTDPEPIQRKSGSLSRKMMTDQTLRLLKGGNSNGGGVLVYDVMDDTVGARARLEYPSGLHFESRFESGNLQMAIKVGEGEYDLILQSDIGSQPGRHNQWFFFSISNMAASGGGEGHYKFNVINMSKGSSQFGEGMQPVVYSVNERMWRRLGDNVCFNRNHYRKPEPDLPNPQSSSGAPSTPPKKPRTAQNPTTYSTLTFHIPKPTIPDTYYIAYHYPYTLTDLTLLLNTLQTGIGPQEAEGNVDGYLGLENLKKFDARCRRGTLCRSVGGNELEVLTITDYEKDSLEVVPLKSRTFVFLTSRVHPGETNASHIMQGLLRFLLSDDETAQSLRQFCVFKIIPLLNPDGVVNGSHRCGLAGTDLNRAWKHPDKWTSPTIFWTKKLWKYLVDLGFRPLVSCDFHGHSKKKNVFLFGNENPSGPNEGLEKVFPSLMSTLSPVFDVELCKYTVEKSKESTQRVVMWRELGVVGSYTLESSYCGADFGEKKGLHFQVSDLEKVGVDFCCAVWAALNMAGDEDRDGDKGKSGGGGDGDAHISATEAISNTSSTSSIEDKAKPDSQVISKPAPAPPKATSTAVTLTNSGRPNDTALTFPKDTHPSQITLKRPPPQEILDEDTYITAVSDIIERDFFPDLKRMKVQNQFLDAVQAGDLQAARTLGLQLQRLKTGKPGNGDFRQTPARFSTVTPSSFSMETPIVTGFTPLQGSETPLSTIAESVGEHQTEPEKPEIETNMSLDAFQSRYTSEDNASFAAILEKSNEERKEKYKWFFDQEKGRMMLEGGGSVTGGNSVEGGEARRLIEGADRQVVPIDSWKYKTKNSLMYYTDGAPQTMADLKETRGPPKSISHSATRFTPSYSTQQVLTASQANLSERLNTQQVWRNLAKATPALFPTGVAPGSPTGAASGFGMIPSTPSLEPHEDVDPSELMTWGFIDGTPMLLDSGGDHSDSGPKFSIPPTPKREELGNRLADRASKSLRQKKGGGYTPSLAATPENTMQSTLENNEETFKTILAAKEEAFKAILAVKGNTSKSTDKALAATVNDVILLRREVKQLTANLHYVEGTLNARSLMETMEKGSEQWNAFFKEHPTLTAKLEADCGEADWGVEVSNLYSKLCSHGHHAPTKYIGNGLYDIVLPRGYSQKEKCLVKGLALEMYEGAVNVLEEADLKEDQ